MSEKKYQTTIENEINLSEMISVLYKNLFLVVLVTLGFAVAMFSYSYTTQKPEYRFSSIISIDSKTKDVYIFNQIVKSDTILDEVVASLEGVKTTKNVLMSGIQVKPILISSELDTGYIEIAFQSNNAMLSESVVRKITELFITDVPTKIEISKIFIINYTEDKIDTVISSSIVKGVFGGVLGFSFMYGYILLLLFFNPTFRTKQDVERILNLPVIGVQTKPRP